MWQNICHLKATEFLKRAKKITSFRTRMYIWTRCRKIYRQVDYEQHGLIITNGPIIMATV